MKVVFPEPKNPTKRYILAKLLASILYIVYNYKMIKGKYNVIEVIKQNDYKNIQRCQKQDGSIYIIKSYKIQEKKLI